MSLSMYESCVPAARRALVQLKHLLATAVEHCAGKGEDPSALLDARLAPDMFPLLRQVQIATDLAKNGVARLAGIAPPPFPDEETSFAELQERIGRALAFVDSVTPAQFEGSETRAIAIPTRTYGDLHFEGRGYLQQFMLPNLYFHVTTAYALLRQAGVPIGKVDFLGPVGSAAEAPR